MTRIQTIAITGGTVNNRSLRRTMPDTHLTASSKQTSLRRKIHVPTGGIEVVQQDAFTSKIIHSAKSSAHIILFHIVMTILAELRCNSFAPFRRHAVNDFVSDYKSLHVLTAANRNGNLSNSLSLLRSQLPHGGNQIADIFKQMRLPAENCPSDERY